jgi:hypothetical protein
VVKAVLLDALPYDQPSQLVTVGVDTPGMSSPPDIVVDEWRELAPLIALRHE